MSQSVCVCLRERERVRENAKNANSIKKGNKMFKNGSEKTTAVQTCLQPKPSCSNGKAFGSEWKRPRFKCWQKIFILWAVSTIQLHECADNP